MKPRAAKGVRKVRAAGLVLRAPPAKRSDFPEVEESMALWTKLKQELDRAGQVAQEAIDESKIRLDAFRARRLADKAAQALGYAVYRARQDGRELDADSYARLSSALAGHEAEAKRHEERLAGAVAERKAAQASRPAPTEPPSTAP